MKFRRLYNYKYQVVEDCIYPTEIQGWEFEDEWLKLNKDGILVLKKGYAWNGANCFPDLESIIKPSAIHDALYQLGRRNILPYECKLKADMLLYKMCLDYGMSVWLANCVFAGVNVGGEVVWREGWKDQQVEMEILDV